MGCEKGKLLKTFNNHKGDLKLENYQAALIISIPKSYGQGHYNKGGRRLKLLRSLHVSEGKEAMVSYMKTSSSVHQGSTKGECPGNIIYSIRKNK